MFNEVKFRNGVKKIITLLLLVSFQKIVTGQSVGIGTTTPNASAQLDVTSTTKGMLIPRMTDAEKNAIPSPAPGLLIYNTNTNSFQYYHGVSWVNISHSGIINGTANKVAKFNSPWGITANTLITDNGTGVAINTSNALPNSSALLDMTSTDKGVLIPRMATAERTAIATPATGLLVFDNTTNSFWFYNGSLWAELTSGAGNSKWNLTGNDIYNNNSGNTGIGTTEPFNKLQVQGSLLVTTPTVATSTAPTVAQTKTMVNAGTITFIGSDSTGRIYDPGGPAGNYSAGLFANANISFAPGAVGIEVTAETMGLGTGDSLIIKESFSSTSNLLAIGNGYTTTGKWVFNSDDVYIIFKSNADANTGIGFSLLFKRLYDNSASLPDVSGATGNALLFDVKNGFFRSGKLHNGVFGVYSTAIGSSIASGDYSTAIGSSAASGNYSSAIGQASARGNFSTAMGSGSADGDYSIGIGRQIESSGVSSIALGYVATASANGSIAIGVSTTSSGLLSTAIGSNITASGDNSTAMGSNTTASGDNSTAMGNYVNTNNHNGAFLIGDNSTTTVMNGTTSNNFRARFANGYRLYTSANLSTSCSLGPGDNAWTTGSSVHTKENFAEVNGEDFLKKISGFHLTSWNYKTQNPATFRHYGPMAQDFYAAFGKDKYGTIGNDTTINSADFAGVSFIAIQALEKRTAEYKKENAELKAMLLQLRKEMDELKKLKL